MMTTSEMAALSNARRAHTDLEQIATQMSQIARKWFVVVSNDETIGDYGPFTAGTTTGGIQEAINALLTSAHAGGTIYIKGIINGTTKITIPQVPEPTMMWLSEYDLLMSLRIIGDGPMCSQYILSNPTGSTVLMDAVAPAENNYSAIYLIIDGVGFAFDTETTSTHGDGLDLANVLCGDIRNVCVWGKTATSGFGLITPSHTKEQMIISNCLVSDFTIGYRVRGDWVTLDRCEAYNCYIGARVQDGYGITFRDFHTISVAADCGSIEIDATYFPINCKIYGVHSENPNVASVAIIKGYSGASNGMVYAEQVRSSMSSIPLSTGQVYIKDSGVKGAKTPPTIPETGLVNAVTNSFGETCAINMTGQAGTHVIDIYGTDITLTAENSTVILNHGEKIYFATTKPSAWSWRAL